MEVPYSKDKELEGGEEPAEGGCMDAQLFLLSVDSPSYPIDNTEDRFDEHFVVSLRVIVDHVERDPRLPYRFG